MEYVISDRMSNLKPSAIREILKATSDPNIIPFAAGNPAPEAFPVETVREITADILTNNAIPALQYSISEGHPPLVAAITEMISSRYSIAREGDSVLITSGAQQGVELATKVLCNEGDTVLCEDPSFIGSLNTFRSYNVNLVGIPLEEDGVNLEKLEHALKTEKNIRFFYVIPNFQNPMGVTTSAAKRRAIYDLCRRYGVMIMEDNPYGDLRFAGEDIPAIKADDPDGIIIYLGSFSKILSPGLRVGYAVAPTPVVQKMVVAKQASDVHTNILAQMLCERFLTQYDFDAHLASLREIYRKKATLMLDSLDAHVGGRMQYTRPQGGLFLWATLPESIDMMEFCSRLVANRVAVVPGSAFTADVNAPTNSFRLNYSTPTDAAIVEGVEILGKVFNEYK